MNPFFLPKLKTDSDVRPDREGEWNRQSAKAFQNVASSLDYQAPGEVKSISSVPTIWARPLSMEMALYNREHPIRTQMIQEWQGMLTAIALAEVRGFPLKAQLLEIRELANSQPFARSLYELLPAPVNTLYTLEGGKNPWQDIYLFLWDGNPVGMTSPSTLVCPSEEGEWTGLPWWLDGRLRQPHNFLNVVEKKLLYLWLENLQRELIDYGGVHRAISIISRLIYEFQASLGNVSETDLSLSDEPQFFGVPINRGALTALNYPVKVTIQPSSVQLIPSREKESIKRPLLIYDPAISIVWNVSPQSIWIYREKTLASLKPEELPDFKRYWQEEVVLMSEEDLFLPELYFIDRKQALPGGTLPKNNEQIIFNGELVTPLIPLNPILLDYFTPEDLIQRLQLQLINQEDGLTVRVIIDLPLSGVQSKYSTQNFRVSKDYLLKEENALSEVPVLEVWPNFKAEGWQDYYVFYYDGEQEDNTFQVRLPEARECHIFRQGRGVYQIAHLEKFPSLIVCQDSEKNPLGLILLKSPPAIQPIPTSSWTVGVDFGTSFTNVYVGRKGTIEPLSSQSLNLKVTSAHTETRFPVLFEHFIPESAYELPLATLLTIRGGSITSYDNARPIFDGRIYVPDYYSFKPQEDWIKTDLKWSTENFSFRRLFLQHLALHISALAVNNGVREVQWSLSFPSTSSRADINRYASLWRDLTQELQKRTGIKQLCPSLDNPGYFRTESLAFAQYFADYERYDLVYTTCIDIGGGTSDISIWEENCLIHQCSVRLAGQDIFSQFLELNPKSLKSLFSLELSEWQNLRSRAFFAKLDVWLSQKSYQWLKQRSYFERENSDFQGLTQLMAIGLAGLYYYVGILLKVLHAEGKYTRSKITPVYIGGRGSLFLNWLAEGGQFTRHSEINALLSRMLSQGSGFEDFREITRMSSRPKDEVACGLVLADTNTRLKELKQKSKDPLIAGENCFINGLEIGWDSRLEFEENLTEFIIPDPEHLRQFLYDFHAALRDLKIETIKPLKSYKASLELDANHKLWRDMSRELTGALLRMRGDIDNIHLEPPFILGLKALLRVLGRI